MLITHIKFTWRGLVKNKFYTIINIAGITLGLTIGILILLWVQNEYSYDSFHHQQKSIYRLENMVGTGSSRQIWTGTVAPIGVLAKNEIPEVKDVARITYNNYYGIFKYGNKTFTNQNAAFTDPSLFTIFDFNLIAGNKSDPFPDLNSVILTQGAAKRFFGDNDPIGKTISVEDRLSFKVTGIIKDIPENSSIRNDIFFPMKRLEKEMYVQNKKGKNLANDFIEFRYDTYLLLKQNTPLNILTRKLREIHLKNKPDDVDIQYLLQPLRKMHLYQADGSDGGIKSVRMFILIAVLILLIACINYVNLSTARSMIRAKEVSVRKIIGATRMQLFRQFLIETTLLYLIASVLAVLASYILLPLFNRVSGQHLTIDFKDYHIWMVIILTIVGTLIISSVYPAWQLSSFKPLKALNGKVSANLSDTLFRKILVTGQFVFSIVLIAGTIIITSQLHYIRSKQLGYDKDQVFTFNMIAMTGHFDAVKNDLINQPGILGITWADNNIVDLGSQTGNNYWQGKEEGETLMLSPMAVNKDFIPFFKIQMALGNNFTGSAADSTHFILNETAVKAARLKDPIGKHFKLWNIEGEIIGVVKDFYFASMKEKIQPAILYYQPEKYGQIYVKTTAQTSKQALAAVKNEWNKYNASFPFSYSFLDDIFNNLYHSEDRVGVLFNIFAGLAIFISCLGLFGLVTYTSQVKKKEIGIRKVLGASTTGIVKLISKDFMKLVLLAIFIATPIAWWLMGKWLESFSYKINISVWAFVFAGIFALLIALVTVSTQAIKAAIANPVNSLKDD